MARPFKTDARPISDYAEIFPTTATSTRPLSFDILWTELCNKPNQRPDTIFPDHLDLLRHLAKDVFLQDNPRSERCGTVEGDCPAADTQSTHDSNRTSSQDSSTSHHTKINRKKLLVTAQKIQAHSPCTMTNETLPDITEDPGLQSYSDDDDNDWNES